MELQQKEDKLSLKNKEIDVIQGHDCVVDVAEPERRGQVEEARSHVEELRDARSLCMFSFSFLSFLRFIPPCRRSSRRSLSAKH